MALPILGFFSRYSPVPWRVRKESCLCALITVDVGMVFPSATLNEGCVSSCSCIAIRIAFFRVLGASLHSDV